jgi:Flp pilus assembly protein TadG
MPFKEERGNILVIVALAMVVLLGFTALAVDGGYLYSRHTRLQDIDDTVAIAAAHGIVQTTGNSTSNKKNAAFRESVEYLQKNNITVGTQDAANYTATISSNGDSGTMTLSFPDGINQVKVDLRLNTSLYFAKTLGKDYTPVSVTATAQIASASKQTGGLIPVGIVANDPLHPDDGWVTGQHYDMTLGPSFGSSGNYGYLSFDQPNMFKTYMQYGYDQTLEVGQTVNTYPGVNAGEVKNAIGARIENDNCTIANYTSHPNCPRLVYTPIVDKIGDSGSSQVTIVGFAAFFIEGYTHNGNYITLSGQFIGMVSPAEITQSYLGYAVQSVRLIN